MFKNWNKYAWYAVGVCIVLLAYYFWWVKFMLEHGRSIFCALFVSLILTVLAFIAIICLYAVAWGRFTAEGRKAVREQEERRLRPLREFNEQWEKDHKKLIEMFDREDARRLYMQNPIEARRTRGAFFGTAEDLESYYEDDDGYDPRDYDDDDDYDDDVNQKEWNRTSTLGYNPMDGSDWRYLDDEDDYDVDDEDDYDDDYDDDDTPEDFKSN